MKLQLHITVTSIQKIRSGKSNTSHTTAQNLPSNRRHSIMSQHHTYRQNLPDTAHNIQKIVLVLFLMLGIILIAISCQFLLEFLQLYKNEINKLVYYLMLAFIFAVIILIFIIMIYFSFNLYFNIQIKRQNYANIQNTVVNKTLNSNLITSTQMQIESGLIYISEQTTEHGTVKFKPLQKNSLALPSSPLARPTTQLNRSDHSDQYQFDELNQPDHKDLLLDHIKSLQRILIIGGQGTGKTTLLKHIAEQHSLDGCILILDSHNTPEKWDKSYTVIGDGRNYRAIESKLNQLVDIMNERYKDLSTGKVAEREHKLITVISDEWTTISKNLNNLDKVLLPLLTESRKVTIDFILASHSETARSLGIKGAYDLKENFDVILRLKLVNGLRLVYVNGNEESLIYDHPGQYSGHPMNIDNFNKRESINKKSIEDNEIIETFNLLKQNNEFSWNKFSLEIYGKKGGHYTQALKEVLDTNSIEY